MAESPLLSSDAWVHWILDECDRSSIPYALRYFEPQKKRLQSLLHPYDLVNCELSLELRGGGDTGGWQMHAVLALPTGRIVSQGADDTLLGTMDRALDDLAAAVKRHVRQAMPGALAASRAGRREPIPARLRPGSAVMAAAPG